VSTHEATRPNWKCGGCGHDWPCRTRRQELDAEFLLGDRSSLFALMALHLADAAYDLPHHAAGDLHDRFIGWIPVRRTPGTGPRHGYTEHLRFSGRARPRHPR
jgi:hypothetical protein